MNTLREVRNLKRADAAVGWSMRRRGAPPDAGSIRLEETSTLQGARLSVSRAMQPASAGLQDQLAGGFLASGGTIRDVRENRESSVCAAIP